jgi:hypothetical protein
MLTRVLFCFGLSLVPCFGGWKQNLINHEPETPTPRVSKLWMASCLMLITATSLDMSSSWGKYEQNSLLRSGDGRFGAKGVSLKVIMSGATLAPQWILRKDRTATKLFTFANLAEAGLYTGIAVHNFGVPTPITH